MENALAGKRILITQADAFMGPVLCEVFADQGAEVHFGTVDHLSSFVQPGDRRYVLQQLPEPFGLGETLFEEGPLRRCVDVRIGDESFEVAVDGTYGGFQLVVDVVGQLPLDADFFLFLVQCGGMFAVAFCEGRPHLNHVFRENTAHRFLVVTDSYSEYSILRSSLESALNS